MALKKFHLLFRWTPAIIWMILIFYLSHQPGEQLQQVVPWFKYFFPWMKDFNWGHYAAYFVLAVFIYTGLGSGWSGRKGKVLTVLLCVLYGVTDEFHQLYVPGRTPDWIDLRNDGIGALVAMALLSVPSIHKLYLKMLQILSIKY